MHAQDISVWWYAKKILSEQGLKALLWHKQGLQFPRKILSLSCIIQPEMERTFLDNKAISQDKGQTGNTFLTCYLIAFVQVQRAKWKEK